MASGHRKTALLQQGVMDPPWLSVCIPTYNGEPYLPFALESIITQGDKDIECIVVDDGSTDGTLSFIAAYQNRLRLIVHQRKRKNWAANTNYALRLATGQYACILHQDDLWLPGRLAVLKSLIAEFPDVGFFLHAAVFIDEEGHSQGLWRCPLPPVPTVISSDMLMERLLVQNFIAISAPVFRRDLALAVGGMDEALWYTADWDFWLKLAAAGPAVYDPRPLSGFRIHSGSQTVRRSASLREFQEQLEIVFYRHFSLWHAEPSRKSQVQRAALFSIEANTVLAGIMHRQPVNPLALALHFLLLGPDGWSRYLINSRIWERMSARLRTFVLARVTRKTRHSREHT